MKFQHPLKPPRYKTQGFKPGHTAIDWGCPNSTNLYASQSGRVAYIRNLYKVNQTGCQYGYGNYLRIDHGDDEGANWQTLYAHLHPHILVNVGDSVNIGDKIGFTDNNGCSTGPHLHFEIRRNNTGVNPELYLEENVTPPEPPVIPPIPVLPKAFTTVRLNVRVRPKVNANKLYTLGINEEVPVMGYTQYDNGDLWLKIGHKEYCAMIYQGNTYAIFKED